MQWLRAQLRDGIIGQDRATVLLSLGLLVLGNVLRFGYDVLNHGPNSWFLKTPLDDMVPVVKPFIVPYLTLQPLIFASGLLFLFFRVRVFQSAALSVVAAFLVSFFFYAFFQTYVDRPQLSGDDPFTWLMAQTYALDNPFNDFPSLHVTLSTIMAIHWWRVDRRIGIAVATWVALIVMSTVFVKQHYLLDVVGGLILAFAVSYFFLHLVVDQAVLAMRPAGHSGR